MPHGVEEIQLSLTLISRILTRFFTVLIWGSDRPKFGDPEEMYRSKHICVTGKISDYKGVPEIIVYEASQIKAQ
jgi:hypothetical protein